MSDYLIFIPAVVVLVCWGLVAFGIRRWGPGAAKRFVRCPEKQVIARVAVRQVEGDFGSLKVSDVTACSVFGSGPVTCDKACLARL